jgi:hypothetical protein
MRYLKTFESHSSDIILTLNDIFQELNDSGFTIYSYLIPDNSGFDDIIVTAIGKRTNINPAGTSNVHRFNTDEVYDDILRSIEFMKDEGWGLSKIHIAGFENKRIIKLKDLKENKSVLLLTLNWKEIKNPLK